MPDVECGPPDGFAALYIHDRERQGRRYADPGFGNVSAQNLAVEVVRALFLLLIKETGRFGDRCTWIVTRTDQGQGRCTAHAVHKEVAPTPVPRFQSFPFRRRCSLSEFQLADERVPRNVVSRGTLIIWVSRPVLNEPSWVRVKRSLWRPGELGYSKAPGGACRVRWQLQSPLPVRAS
jgi:hypothetical protein